MTATDGIANNTVGQDIVWTPTDLKNNIDSSTSITIRKGDSLLLTDSEEGTALWIDTGAGGSPLNFGSSANDGITPAGNNYFPCKFDVAGTYLITSTVTKADATTVKHYLKVKVLSVNLDGPIACEVGYQREKGVDIFGGGLTSGGVCDVVSTTGGRNDVVFSSNDPYLMDVSVKAAMNYGARLFLKAKKRGTPILLARLSGAFSPMLAMQEVDEFTRDSKNLQSLLVANNVGNGGELILRPFIPNLTVDLSMFAHASTFANGATTLAVNTDQFDKVYDPVTAETIAVLHLTIEMPQGENSFCFNYAIDQHSSHGSPVAATITVNNVAYKFWVDPIVVPIGTNGYSLYITTEASSPTLTVTGSCDAGGPTITGPSFEVDGQAHRVRFDSGNNVGKFPVAWFGETDGGSGETTTFGAITVVKVEDIIGAEEIYVKAGSKFALSAVLTYNAKDVITTWSGDFNTEDRYDLTAIFEAGLFTGSGIARISCGSSSMTVKVTVVELSVSLSPALIPAGGSSTATVVIVPSDLEGAVTWTVSGNDNSISGDSGNTATITAGSTGGRFAATASIHGVSETAELTVAAVVGITAYTPRNSTDFVLVGDFCSLEAVMNPARVGYEFVTWNPTRGAIGSYKNFAGVNPEFAFIDTSKPGAFTRTASCGTSSKSVTVIVYPKLISIAPAPGYGSVGINTTFSPKNILIVTDPNDEATHKLVNISLPDLSKAGDATVTASLAHNPDATCVVHVDDGWILVSDNPPVGAMATNIDFYTYPVIPFGFGELRRRYLTYAPPVEITRIVALATGLPSGSQLVQSTGVKSINELGFSGVIKGVITIGYTYTGEHESNRKVQVAVPSDSDYVYRVTITQLEFSGRITWRESTYDDTTDTFVDNGRTGVEWEGSDVTGAWGTKIEKKRRTD